MRGLPAILIAAVCVSAPASASAQEFVYDPFEDFNRGSFAVHETLDKNIFEPVARGYRYITPQPVRSGVRNFLRNLSAPVVFANDVLQGEGERAATTFARFGLNTTIGVLGIFDPAEDMGLERHDEDFGQTLAVWGVPSGPYLFVPVLGPTNVRDGFGRVVDVAFQPLTWAQFEGDEEFGAVRGVMTGVSTREGVLDAVDDVRQNSLDPYTTYRSTYGLFRYSAIQNGRRDVQDLPEFEEIEELPPEIGNEIIDPNADLSTAPGDEPSDLPEVETPDEPAADTSHIASFQVGELQ